MATRDELLRGNLNGIKVTKDMKISKKMAEELSLGVYPPLFHMYRKKGLYVFRFFKEFSWKYVIIDERLPCKKSTGRPLYGSCKEIHELWVPLIEKAYGNLYSFI